MIYFSKYQKCNGKICITVNKSKSVSAENIPEFKSYKRTVDCQRHSTCGSH